MKIVIAIDSFKGSLSSIEAGNAVSNGIYRVFPEAEISIYPLADGGIGCLQALGFDMLNADGNQVDFGAAGLSQLAHISADNVIPCLSECRFQIACDVTNPLYGENGCSAVFVLQKGADSTMVTEMDSYMKKYAELTKRFNPTADPEIAGAGAAGGFGFAFVSYLNASLESGIDLVLRKIKLEDAVRNADIVITGEGCLDAQSIMGKAPIGVAKLAKKYDKPVIAFCGIAKDENILGSSSEIDAYFPVLRNMSTADEAMNSENAKRNLALATQQVFRVIDKFMK